MDYLDFMHYNRQFSGDRESGSGRVRWSSHDEVDRTDFDVVIGDTDGAKETSQERLRKGPMSAGMTPDT